MDLRIRRLSYSLGAEIIGADVRQSLDDKTFGHIHAAFLEYGILLFRGQPITQEHFIAFTRRFGEADKNTDNSSRFRHPEYPEIGFLFNHKTSPKGKPTDTYQAERWHTDRSFTLIPTMITLLRAIDMPDVGGDTMFANMYLAYETLSDGMKKLIDGLDCVHIGGKTPKRRERGVETDAVAQPLVRVHPETGRKALYMCEYPKITQFVGMTEEESKPLIQFLCNHATRPQFCYRHQWRNDDLLMWDNRRLMHRALGDYDKTQNRDLERTTVMGTPSGYVYDGPLGNDSSA